MLKTVMKHIKTFGLFLMMHFYIVFISFHMQGNHIVTHL